MAKILIAFSAGVVIGIASRAIWARRIADRTEMATDVASAEALMQEIPFEKKVLDLLSSRDLESAKSLLAFNILGDLSQVWIVNNKYGGLLDTNLDLLVTTVYPSVRDGIDWNRFSNFAPSTLNDISNFMAAVETRKSSMGRGAAAP